MPRLTCAAVGAVVRALRYPRDALDTPAPPLGGVAGFLPPVDTVDCEAFLPGRYPPPRGGIHPSVLLLVIVGLLLALCSSIHQKLHYRRVVTLDPDSIGPVHRRQEHTVPVEFPRPLNKDLSWFGICRVERRWPTNTTASRISAVKRGLSSASAGMRARLTADGPSTTT